MIDEAKIKKFIKTQLNIELYIMGDLASYKLMLIVLDCIREDVFKKIENQLEQISSDFVKNYNKDNCHEILSHLQDIAEENNNLNLQKDVKILSLTENYIKYVEEEILGFAEQKSSFETVQDIFCEKNR